MEIHRGQLRAAPIATALHNDIALNLRSVLRGSGDARSAPGWVFVADVDIEFPVEPEEVRAPDVAGYRRERWQPAWRQVVPIPAPPNWLCEVWSPGNSLTDREELMRVYYEAREVETVWTIDPALSTLKVFRREAKGWKRELVVDSFDERLSAAPFPSVSLTLAELME